ncbi:hypothetical protein NMY22_g17351 [Coprinellus aureogranulatus]|nr:hypothetical protein NMY22_g17351 [Coprinellus aureogranulatus]
MLSQSLGFSRRALTTCSRRFSTTSYVFAGHNKWSKIKERKGVNDAHKSVLYTKANKDIIVAARGEQILQRYPKTGGSPDPTKNIQLATVVRRYRDAGVPKENIERALDRANPEKGKGGGPVVYEALACGSVGLVIECLTDNPTRTIHNVRAILTKHGAHLTPVKFMFERKGLVQVTLDKNTADLEKVTESLIEAALGAEAEDFDQQPDDENPDLISLKFTSPPESVKQVSDAVMALSESIPSLRLQKSELIYSPTEVSEPNEEVESQVGDVVADLEEDEDTLRIWTSLDSR